MIFYLKIEIFQDLGIDFVKLDTEIGLNRVESRVLKQLIEPLIGLAHSIRVRMVHNVVDNALGLAGLVHVGAGLRASVRNVPHEAAGFAGWVLAALRSRLFDINILANVYEALLAAVLSCFYAIAGLRVNEDHVAATLLLELGDLVLVELTILWIGNFFCIIN